MTNINGVLPQADPDQDDHLAPITGMISSRLIVLANLLKRGGSCATSVWRAFLL
jgi:hypothetical protein